MTNIEINSQPAWKQIRCMHCGRKFPATVLDIKSYLNESKDCFECVDKEACAAHKRKDKTVTKVHIYFDAACQGKNTTEGQNVAIGIYVELNKVVAPEYFFLKSFKGSYTNNDGEWLACIYAYKVALLINQKIPNAIYHIFGDSQIVINCVNGINKTGSKFKHSLARVEKHKAKFKKQPTLLWVRREINHQADKLSKKALLL